MLLGPFLDAELDVAGVELGGDAGQEFRGDRLVDQQRLDRVAHPGTLAFGIDHDVLRHLEVSLAIDIDMADALVMLDHRDV